MYKGHVFVHSMYMYVYIYSFSYNLALPNLWLKVVRKLVNKMANFFDSKSVVADAAGGGLP